MKVDFDQNELRALFAAFNDGTISPADHARLDRILAGSAEARQLWFLHSDIETGLADWAAMRHAAGAEKTVSFSRPTSSPAGPTWNWLVPLTAAAVLMFGAAWWLHENRKTAAVAEGGLLEAKAKGVAVLTRAVGVEWADGTRPSAGALLEPGMLRLKSGAALLEFFSGARLVVEGPAEVRLMSVGEVFLRSGKINAHVPPQARGFTVSSPTMNVVDFGTDFGVTVGDGAAPEVHVFSGKVEVASASFTPRPLIGGEAARLEGGALQTIPAARASFLAEDELVHRDSAFGQQRLAAWRESSRALSADPATAIHFTFEAGDALERRITDRSANASLQTHGSVVGSAWAEGRWPGKGALQFRSEGDRVRFIAPQPMPAVTLLAWVRVDALPRWQNVLLSAESEQPGALHWHLMKSGELRLEIARDLGRSKSDWEAVNSAPFVTADRLGQWLLLATTFDGKTIRHYGNGQPIGSGASFTPPALHIGTAELANWRGATQRHLAAAVDEFAILSRAMSAEEVLAVFQNGKP